MKALVQKIVNPALLIDVARIMKTPIHGPQLVRRDPPDFTINKTTGTRIVYVSK